VFHIEHDYFTPSSFPPIVLFESITHTLVIIQAPALPRGRYKGVPADPINRFPDVFSGRQDIAARQKAVTALNRFP
jgi:hypothetical protein